MNKTTIFIKPYFWNVKESSLSFFSISVRDGDTVKHYRIRQLDEGGFFIARRTTFRTLQELVLHYSNDADGLCVNLCKPCVQVRIIIFLVFLQTKILKKVKELWLIVHKIYRIFVNCFLQVFDIFDLINKISIYAAVRGLFNKSGKFLRENIQKETQIIL